MFKIALILLNHVIYNTAALHMPDTSRYTQSVTKIPYSPKDEHQKCVWIMQHFIIHKTVHRFLFFICSSMKNHLRWSGKSSIITSILLQISYSSNRLLFIKLKINTKNLKRKTPHTKNETKTH